MRRHMASRAGFDSRFTQIGLSMTAGTLP
jgi:hypothetical protein